MGDRSADVERSPRGRTFHVPAHPGSSSDTVSRRMSGQGRRDTRPEIALRRLLHASGYRYRVAWPVPGKPRRTIDVAFTKAEVAVFVDGCFWHGCPEHGTAPSANSAWWAAKIAANQDRDSDTTAHLIEQGWTVLRLWEHTAAIDGEVMVRFALAHHS